MKRFLTATEYIELRLLVNRILSAENKESAATDLKALETLCNRSGSFSSVGRILAELYTLLKIAPSKTTAHERLSYFTYTDSYLAKLREFVQVD